MTASYVKKASKEFVDMGSFLGHNLGSFSREFPRTIHGVILVTGGVRSLSCVAAVDL